MGLNRLPIYLVKRGILMKIDARYGAAETAMRSKKISKPAKAKRKLSKRNSQVSF